MTPEVQAQLAAQEAEIVALRKELDETNRGVLALYAELDDKAAELREATELKSRFLSYMSHEFRTPLTSITSITGILLSRLDGPLSSEQLKQVEFIRTSARELTDMVGDLLDLAKVEAGRITISPEWFELVDLLSALRGMFKPIVASTSISLLFDEPKDDIKLFTDDKKLSQILRNFISNALKFTPKAKCGSRPQFSLAIAWSSRSPIRVSASRLNTFPICSRTSCSSMCACRSACGARASDSHCRGSLPSFSVAKCTRKASSAKDRASRWCCR